MKYNQPPGEATDAAYVDGNRSAGTKGSVVPAAAVEFPQRELVNLINFAGMTPDNADLEQVRKAIETLISAATGGGDTSQFLLVSQARARLPIFPEILSSDGRVNVTSPGAGSILVPPTVAFQHRGIFPANTSDYSEPNRTFTTVSNKTYHLRWSPTDGFELKDVANATYNPSAVAEIDTRFDSSFDDMLVARIVTNASNVATITNLVNKQVMMADGFAASKPVGTANGTLTGFDIEQDVFDPKLITQYATAQIDWSRKPQSYLTALQDVIVTGSAYEFTMGTRALSRYQVAVWAQGDAASATGWAARA